MSLTTNSKIPTCMQATRCAFVLMAWSWTMPDYCPACSLEPLVCDAASNANVWLITKRQEIIDNALSMDLEVVQFRLRVGDNEDRCVRCEQCSRAVSVTSGSIFGCCGCIVATASRRQFTLAHRGTNIMSSSWNTVAEHRSETHWPEVLRSLMQKAILSMVDARCDCAAVLADIARDVRGTAAPIRWPNCHQG